MTLPNLVPEVHDLFVHRAYIPDPGSNTATEGPPLLYFDTRAQNLGTVALDLATDDVTGENPSIRQCVEWSAGRVCRDRRSVDGFTWSGPTTAAAFTNYSTSEFRLVGIDGRPDYSAAGLLDTVDRGLPCFNDAGRLGPDGSPAPLYYTCTSARQGVTEGWTAVNSPSSAVGQFPLTGLGDGLYAIVARIDPANHLYEADESDNVTETIVEISDGVRRARVVARYYP